MTQGALASMSAERTLKARRSFHALYALAAALTCTLLLYANTGIAMVNIWRRSDTFAHAFLVIPITVWLVWRQRAALAAQVATPSFKTLWVLACAALLWLLGDLSDANSLTQLAFVALLVLSVPLLFGWTISRAIAFPLGFIFFAVPIGEFLIPQLMEWTAEFTILALRMSGIPVYREGLQFIIPSGSWSVVEACSGVRYLIASLTVGTLFAYLNFQSNRRRIVFALFSLVVPVVANWLRAYLIVMLGHWSDNRIASGFDHLIYGWVFFGIVILAMFMVGARWSEGMGSEPVLSTSVPTPQQLTSNAMLWTAAGCMALLVAIPQGVTWAIGRGAGPDQVQISAPVALAEDWQARPDALSEFKPNFPDASAEVNTSYSSQSRVVGLYLGYFRNQNHKRKLISSSNALVRVGERNWTQGARGNRILPIGGQMVTLRTADVGKSAAMDPTGKTHLMVWQFYWINGQITANDYLAKAYGALSRLLGQGDDAAAIIVYTENTDRATAEDALGSFLSANYTVIEKLLRTTQQRARDR